MKKYNHLENENIILSLISIKDFEEVFLLMNSRDVLDTMVADFPLDRDEWYNIFKASPDMAARGKGYSYIIVHKKTNKTAGLCDLIDVHPKRKKAEIGYLIDPGFRRKGIAYNACTLLINFAFSELGLHKIWAETFSTNQASQGLLAKLGFRKIGVQKNEVIKHGKWRDRVLYELLASSQQG